jgi:hypothetical protein
MLIRLKGLVVFIAFCAIVSLAPSSLGQESVAEFHNILREKLTFDDTDLAALQRGNTVVKLLPVQDKKEEVAVSGSVGLQVPAQVFLQSFRENMTTKSNPAILEIGRFGNQPTLNDLKDLTFETRDIEDLKTCVVGDCKLKLSASMIESFRRDMNWNAPDYTMQATLLLKLMLLDYVRDYLVRGDVALIEYSDKEKTVRMAQEQRALQAASPYINGMLTDSQYHATRSTLPNIENAIVWSKIKFGLKPVIAINHITIYKNPNETGPQVLIASKQIYANHYFNSSLALTAVVSIPDAGLKSYLIYENRSRADGLGGPFGSMKRGVVADKAVSALTAILEQSKARLNARALSRAESAPAMVGRSWKRWKIAGVHLFFWLSLITAFAALFALGKYHSKTELP